MRIGNLNASSDGRQLYRRPRKRSIARCLLRNLPLSMTIRTLHRPAPPESPHTDRYTRTRAAGIVSAVAEPLPPSGSGRLKERQRPRWCAGRQTQMREYPDNHRRLFDGGDDLQGAATLRAVFDVDIEHALEQARPALARRRFMRVVGRISARFLRCARHNRGAQPRVGRQRAVNPDDVLRIGFKYRAGGSIPSLMSAIRVEVNAAARPAQMLPWPSLNRSGPAPSSLTNKFLWGVRPFETGARSGLVSPIR